MVDYPMTEKPLADFVAKKAGIGANSALNREDLRKIARLLKHLEFHCDGLYVQFGEEIPIGSEKRIKVQPIVEHLNLCQTNRVVLTRHANRFHVRFPQSQRTAPVATS